MGVGTPWWNGNSLRDLGKRRPEVFTHDRPWHSEYDLAHAARFAKRNLFDELVHLQTRRMFAVVVLVVLSFSVFAPCTVGAENRSSAKRQGKQRPCACVLNDISNEKFGKANELVGDADHLVVAQEYDKALKKAQLAKSICPEFWSPYALIGQMLILQGKKDLAIKEYESFMKINQKSAMPYIAKSEVEYSRGNFNRAIEDGTRAVQLAAQDKSRWYESALPYYARAKAYFGIGKYDKAIADLDYCLSYYSGVRINARILRGRAKAYLGDKAGAREDFRKAVEGLKMIIASPSPHNPQFGEQAKDSIAAIEKYVNEFQLGSLGSEDK